MPTSTQSIREIVSTQPSAAQIFLRFDIDLCAHADESLNEACAELQLSVDQVLEKLADAEAIGAAPVDPASLPVGRLIQHIVRVHHQRVRQELPGLAEMAHKLAAKRGDRAPELKSVEALAEELRADLFSHIQKEEQVLFPFISEMAENTTVGTPSPHECFGSVARPISMMMQEHESAGRTMVELRRLTNGFEPPAWACATHIALFGGLRAFELDLEQHVHLENDVLFPRAIEMEAALNRRG
jgi:regulator of cell morphogenesis and NO signaling